MVGAAGNKVSMANVKVDRTDAKVSRADAKARVAEVKISVNNAKAGMAYIGAGAAQGCEHNAIKSTMQPHGHKTAHTTAVGLQHECSNTSFGSCSTFCSAGACAV